MEGLTWRIDPTARNADLLTPGKVMFVTGRGVGRVIDARRDSDDLAVTIGPVAITEVIKDGTFTADQPISLQDATGHYLLQPSSTNPLIMCSPLAPQIRTNKRIARYQQL